MKYLLIITCAIISACGSTKDEQLPKARIPSLLSPNRCRILGTVSSIDPILSSSQKSPCSKVPCKAKIRITKILGYGSSFTANLSESDEVDVSFIYTLSPTTKDLFPDLQTRFKGLEVGESFIGDLEYRYQLGAESAIVVYDYE